MRQACGGNYVKVTETETQWLCCPNNDMMHTKDEIHILHVIVIIVSIIFYMTGVSWVTIVYPDCGAVLSSDYLAAQCSDPFSVLPEWTTVLSRRLVSNLSDF